MSNFAQFTDRLPADDDYAVGYNTAVTGGEGRYKFSAIGSYVQNFLSLGTAASKNTGTGAGEIPLNSEIGSTIQAWDAGLDSIAGLGITADKMLYATGVNTFATTDITASARSLLDDASFSDMRTTLGLAIGTDVQAHDPLLDDISGLTLAQGDMIFYNGANLIKVAVGSVGQVLKLTAGPAPAWSAPSTRTAVVDPATPYTPSDGDVVVWDASAGNKTLSLPAAASSTDFVIDVKKTDSSANTITIDPNGAELIDGAANAVITVQYEAISIFCDGTEWWILAA